MAWISVDWPSTSAFSAVFISHQESIDVAECTGSQATQGLIPDLAFHLLQDTLLLYQLSFLICTSLDKVLTVALVCPRGGGCSPVIASKMKLSQLCTSVV